MVAAKHLRVGATDGAAETVGASEGAGETEGAAETVGASVLGLVKPLPL